MKRFHQLIFVLLLSVLLLASQQAAFVHVLGHLRASDAATGYQQDHGATDKLAEACTTCVAFAGIGGNTPLAHFAVFLASFADGAYLLPFASAHYAYRVDQYRARAPPSLL